MKRLSLLLGIAGLSLACGAGGGSTSSILTPTPTVSTETFSGAVDIGGADIHTFNVALSGSQLNVTLTDAGPPSTIYMGLAVGSVSAGVCTPLSGASVLAQAGGTAQLSGTISAGSYCVAVYDVGNQTAPVTYSVTVSHF